MPSQRETRNTASVDDANGGDPPGGGGRRTALRGDRDRGRRSGGARDARALRRRPPAGVPLPEGLAPGCDRARGAAPRTLLLARGRIRGARRRVAPVRAVRLVARQAGGRERRLGGSGRLRGAGVRVLAARRGGGGALLLRNGSDPGR